MKLFFVAAVVLAATALTAPAETTFTVDFARPSGAPLVKNRFGVYQTPLVRLERLVASLPRLREAGVQDFRYELGWGKPDALASSQIGGVAAKPEADLAALDPLIDGLRALGVRPLLALGYCPDPLKSTKGWASWQDVPSDLTQWQGLCRTYADHWRAPAGAPPTMYEVWNEPDLPEGKGKMFFAGTAQDYGKLYAATVAGVRQGDPAARIGGPAVAYDLSYLAPILAQPMDFASIHAYDNYQDQLANLRRSLGTRTGVPLFLTEYASFAAAGMPPDGPQSHFRAAALFFRDATRMLALADLEKVYWAQWLDAGDSPGMGLITWDGHRKAIFNAFKIYGKLPVNRVSVTPPADTQGVHVLASVEELRAGMVLWNESGTDCTVRVNFGGLPFRKGEVETSRIDAHHSSFLDDPSAEDLRVLETTKLTGDTANTWEGPIPAGGVVSLVTRSSE